MENSKEKAAIYLGWIGFIIVLIGLFAPWATYTQLTGIGSRTAFMSGLGTPDGFLLIAGTLAIIAGLLSSTVKPSSASIAFLGTGAMAIILITGWFLSTYYGQGQYYYGYHIQDILTGGFITLIGGFLTVAAAILYSLHSRTPNSEEKTPPTTPAP